MISKFNKNNRNLQTLKAKTFIAVDKNDNKILCAKVRGFRKYFATIDGRIFNGETGKILKPSDNGHGYLTVSLCREGFIRTYTVHRLVVEAFNLHIPENLEINHLNGIKTDNRLLNLEVATPSENMRHAVEIGLIKTVPVLQVDKSSFKILRGFKSIAEASAQTGVNKGGIFHAINGNRKSAGKFIWLRKDNFNVELNGYQLRLNL